MLVYLSLVNLHVVMPIYNNLQLYGFTDFINCIKLQCGVVILYVLILNMKSGIKFVRNAYNFMLHVWSSNARSSGGFEGRDALGRLKHTHSRLIILYSKALL